MGFFVKTLLRACIAFIYLIMYLYSIIWLKFVRGLYLYLIFDVGKCYYYAYRVFVKFRRRSELNIF